MSPEGRGWGSSTPGRCPSRNFGGRSRRDLEASAPNHGRIDVYGNDPDGPARVPRRFAQRTRDYGRAYLALETGGDIESKDMIGKMNKTCKAHRNIFDMEPGSFDKQQQFSLRRVPVLIAI